MKLKLTDTTVAEHVKMMQGIINRLAGNSSACKKWCIAILTALLALANNKGVWDVNILKISILPLLSFYFLDCFYLGLEREMKTKQSEFLWKVRRHEDIDDDLYLGGKIQSDTTCEPECKSIQILKRLKEQVVNTLYGVVSFSTTVFYLPIIVFIAYFIYVLGCQK